MRICSWSWFALVLSSLALPALAQTQPANTVRTLLAAGHLGSVVDTPLHFRLFAVRLPAMEHVPYTGPNSVLYVLSGTLTVALDGTAQTVSDGAGVFIPAVRTTVFPWVAAGTTRSVSDSRLGRTRRERPVGGLMVHLREWAFCPAGERYGHEWEPVEDGGFEDRITQPAGDAFATGD